MILQATINKLEKGKVYCKSCLNENIINEIKVNKNNICEICKKHYMGYNTYFVKYNFKLQDWYVYRGKNLNKNPIGKLIYEKDLQIDFLNNNIDNMYKITYLENLLNNNNIKLKIIENKENNGIFNICNISGEDYLNTFSVKKCIWNYKNVDIYIKCNCKNELCNEYIKIIYKYKLIEIINNPNNYKIYCENHKQPRILKASIDFEHKSICEKYHQKYKNEYSWRSYSIGARNKNISTEEYLKLLYENDLEIKNHKLLFKSKGFEYKDERDYKAKLNAAKNRNLNMNEYLDLLNKEKKYEEQKDNLLISYDKDPKNWGQILIKAHLANFNTGNDFNDMQNYLKYQKEINDNINNIREEHKSICIKYGKSYTSEYSWSNYKRSANSMNLTVEEYFKETNKILNLLECDEINNEFNKNIKKLNKTKKNKYKLNKFIEENFKILKEFISKIENIEYIINNKNKFKNVIYCWYIDNIPYYIGQSTKIVRRCYDHIKEMFNNKKYWLNITDGNINKDHTIKIDILCVCDNKDDLNKMEKYYCQKLLPMSQRCQKGWKYDSILPYKLRNYNIDNLKEKYKERLNNNKI